MARNHYRTLRVPRNESARGIRSAYRRLARECHPDYAGPSGEATFKRITEAFEVLSDARRREDYDRELAGERPRPRKSETEASHPPGPREPPEPLIPPRSPFAPTADVRPGLEPLLERWRRNFTGLGVPKSERVELLGFEVVLDADEARRGGWLPIELPVFVPCPTCGGVGWDSRFPCLTCDRQGLVERRRAVQVRIPPGIPSGTLLEVPLEGLGVHNFAVRLHVRVAAP